MSDPQAPTVSFWRDPQKRAIAFQIMVVVLVLAFFLYLFNNTLDNLEQRGISTGFGFLWLESGFEILLTLIPYDAASTYGRTFLVGLLNTILVSIIGIFFATVIGFVMGVARLSNNWLIKQLASVYIGTFRNIPLLLQIVFWYFVFQNLLPHPRESMVLGDTIFLNQRGLYVPAPVEQDGMGIVMMTLLAAIAAIVVLSRWAKRRQDDTGRQFPVFWISLAVIVGLPGLVFLAMGMPLSWDYPSLQGFNFRGGITVIPELFALALALAAYTAAFIAEIVRSGIQAVSHGQTEAAHALGVRPSTTLRLVVIPQAMRVIIPQMTSQYLNLTKNSSLAPAIGYPDLVAVFAGTTLNNTGQAVEIIAMTMGVYLLLSLLISVFMNWYNKKMALVER